MDEDVPDLIEMYADEMRRRGDTNGSIRVRGSSLRTVAGDCGELETLSEGQLLSWLDNRRLPNGAPVAASTRGTYISALNSFYSWAIENNQVSVSVTFRTE
jgi:hypothetical protein